MARPETLELRFGPGRWFTAAHLGIFALGLLAILITPANWVWKAGATILLIIVSILTYASTCHKNQSGVIRLYTDGVLHFLSIAGKSGIATLGSNAWISRWFTVLPLSGKRAGRRRYYIICSSQNHPDEYRRLLRFLRMRTTAPEVHRIIW